MTPLTAPPRARRWDPDGPSRADSLRALPREKRERWLSDLTQDEALCLQYDWDFWARPRQQPPPFRYLIWLLMCGRGWGKTRCGSEWTIRMAYRGVGGGRIALVGRTDDEAADVMIGGESGILAHSPPWFRPKWVSTRGELRWPNGVIGSVFGAYTPDSFRGYQHGAFWCLTGDAQVAMADGSTKPLADVRRGDRVATRLGPRRVTASMLTRRDAPVLSLTLVGGRTITGTADHPVWVEGAGFVPLGEVKVGDRCVIAVSNGEAAAGTSPVAPPTTPGPTALTPGAATARPRSACTGLSGKRSTAPSHRGTTSTTATATRWTTGPRTSSSSPEAPTRPTTWLTAPCPVQPNATWSWPVWQRSAPAMSAASAALPVAYVGQPSPVQPSAHASTARPSASRGPAPRASRGRTGAVTPAGRPTAPSAAPRGIAASGATTGRPVAGSWSLGRSPAPSAGTPTPRPEPMPGSAAAPAPWHTTTDTVLSVVPSGRADVYDISVEEAREFFANGILVHNCDEMASWLYPEAFSQLLLGLRLGKSPQGIVTTTPKPVKHLRDLLDRPTTALTSGTTYDNLHNLADTFREEVLSQFEGTTMGAQELEGRLLTDVPGALFRRGNIDQLRVMYGVGNVEMWRAKMKRIVVGVDPAAASSTASSRTNNTGIVVCGLGHDNDFYVLEDVTVNDKPHIWAAAAASAYHRWQADRIVVEVNQGGDMCEATIKVVDPTVAIKTVYASRGKMARAEPIASLYEQGRVHHVGGFPYLEDEMCTYDPLEWRPASGASGSPDRLDAMVWGMTELLSRAKTGRILTTGDAIKRDNPYGSL